MKRYHGPMRYMGNFKAVAIDYEYYLTLSDKPQSVCLTERQMYVLSVQNTYTSWFTRWYNTDDITENTVQFIGAEIEGLLMCSCGIPEPSITDRFNSQTYITNTGATYETTYNTWNDAGQTVYSIAPNLDYSSGSSADKDKLICLALNMLIVNIVEAAKANKQGTDQGNRDMVKNMGSVFGGLAVAGGAATAAGGAAAGFVAFIGGPYLILGLALTAVGLAIANLVWTTDISVFTDAAAIEKVRCTLSANILGDTPTRERFQGGLTPNDFTPGSNAAKLAAIVQHYLDDLDTYLQWLATANGLYEVSDFGILPDCEQCVWDYCFDFTADNGGFSAGVLGTWSSGTGWQDTFHQGGNGYRGLDILLVFDPGTTITSVEYTFTISAGTLTGTGESTSYFGVSSGVLINVFVPTVPTSPQTWAGSATATSIEIQLLAGAIAGVGDPGGSVTLTRLCLSGTGNNPFE